MTTVTLLNGHLYTEGYIIFLIICIPVPIFHLLFCQETFVLNCCLLLLTPAYIRTLQAIFDHMKTNIDP